MRFELKDTGGQRVVSIDVARKGIERRAQTDACCHVNVRVDPMLTTLQCDDCKAQINPVEWVASLAEYWDHVDRLYDRLKAQREEIAELDRALELKRRATCEHCQRVTRVRIPTSWEARRRLRAVRETD